MKKILGSIALASSLFLLAGCTSTPPASIHGLPVGLNVVVKGSSDPVVTADQSQTPKIKTVVLKKGSGVVIEETGSAKFYTKAILWRGQKVLNDTWKTKNQVTLDLSSTSVASFYKKILVGKTVGSTVVATLSANTVIPSASLQKELSIKSSDDIILVTQITSYTK